MKIFKIHKDEYLPVALFAALFALVEGSSGLAISAGEAIFMAGAGVEGLPATYVLMFVVMSAAMGAIALAQSKTNIDKVLKGFLTISAVFVAAISAGLAFSPSDGIFRETLFYVLRLATAVWVSAGFSVYWNYVDEHFNIRDGKRFYAIFSAVGCLGGVAGAGLVYLFSKWLKLDAANLLWLWLACIVAAIPLVSKISKTCKRLDSGVNLETASASIGEVVSANFSAMARMPYVRSILLMYIAVVGAATINEYAAFSVFSEHAAAAVDAETLSPDKARELSQLELASMFALLTVGVNLFNFLVNIFAFNRLVARLGVGNVALLQSAFHIVAFAWLINSFGMPAAVFSFFVCRGTMESIDANNENLMVSVLPGALRQNVRLMIEAFVAPFATAAAGVFLMIFAEGGADAPTGFVSEIAERLGLGTLSLSGISVAGFIAASSGIGFAFVCRCEYPRMLETNLRAGWLDFSESARKICAKLNPFESFFSLAPAGSAPMILAAAEIEAHRSPSYAAAEIFKNSELFSGGPAAKAKALLEEILSRKDFDTLNAAIGWLSDRSKKHTRFAVLAAADANPVAAAIASRRGDIALETKREIRDNIKARAVSDFDIDAVREMTAAEKIRLLNRCIRAKNKNCMHLAAELIEDADARVKNSALILLSECDISKLWITPERLASNFKTADEYGKSAILKIARKTGSSDCFEPMLSGVSKISAHTRREITDTLVHIGASAVPPIAAIINDKHYSYESKSVCAAALNKIFPAQLKMLAPKVIDAELRRAYSFAAAERALQGVGFDSECLRRVLAWRRRQAVDFIIEMYSLSGKIPTHEIVSAALFSNGGKERGNALETLEIGISHAEFEALAPLIDGRSLRDTAEFGVNKFRLTEPSPEEIVRTHSESYLDAGFLAATAILLSVNPTSAAGALCKRIGREKSGDVRDDLLDLMDRIVFMNLGGSSAGIGIPFSAPQKFAALSNCKYFSNFEPGAIVELLKNAKVLDAGERTFDGDGVVVFSGRGASGHIEVRKGKTAAISQPDSVFVSSADIFAVAREFPECAQALYLRGEETL